LFDILSRHFRAGLSQVATPRLVISRRTQSAQISSNRDPRAISLPAQLAKASLCDTYPMQSPLQSPTASTDPKSVKVNLTSGTGVDIEWNDGHVSHYNFVYLRDACPCAMCEDERGKTGRRPGEPATAAPGALLIFKPHAKPLSAEGVGKYAIKFSWNDNHDLGIYSWKFLREVCPCEECKASQTAG
jgi:DUF971 family protein